MMTTARGREGVEGGDERAGVVDRRKGRRLDLWW
jgi:hypothetical protein